MAIGRPVLVGESEHFFRTGDRVGGAGRHRGPDGESDVTRLGLVAELADRVGRRADPGEAGGDDRLGEVGVLGEEAVAGMHAVGAGLLGDLDQLVDAQVRLRRGVAIQRVRLVRLPHMKGVPVGIGVDGNGSKAVVAAGPGNPDGNLSTVSDEDFAHDSRS